MLLWGVIAPTTDASRVASNPDAGRCGLSAGAVPAAGTPQRAERRHARSIQSPFVGSERGQVTVDHLCPGPEDEVVVRVFLRSSPFFLDRDPL